MTRPKTDLPRPDTRERTRVPICELRWSCDATQLELSSTDDVSPIEGVMGQEEAVEALSFGLETDAPGMNVYVRGLSGTGRMRLLRHLLDEVQPGCSPSSDLAYVRNFEEPDRPVLLTLPRGRGREFRQRIDERAVFIREELLPALNADEMKERRQKLEQSLSQASQEIGRGFDEELASQSLASAAVQTPAGVRPAIFPLIDGEATPPAQLAELVKQGKLEESQAEELRARAEDYQQRLGEVQERIQELQEEHRKEMRELIEREARRLLETRVRGIGRAFDAPEIHRFLAGVAEDVVEHQLGALEQGKDPTRRYGVNLILSRGTEESCPILVENQPSLARLVGTVERQLVPGGGVYSDHTMIRPGSILEASGGYLVLEAREVLSEPGAWRILMRTLRTGKLEVASSDSLLFGSSSSLKPDPIPIELKVILIGEPGLYYALDSGDPDFSNLFKVLVDFDDQLPRSAEAVRYYAGVLARLVEEESLAPFESCAIAMLAEYGARIAGRNDRLTTRFGRLGDLAREASFVARKAGRQRVLAEDVSKAVHRSRRRADLPARKFRQAIAEGSIRIATDGGVVGQVNGLAVTSAGPLTYGFPARITASIGPGHAGAIDIESASQLSGSIHTKGFHILGGLLRHLMRGQPHSLAFSASIAFEQSYGGIDGDSASGAEMCCLLSALTGVPLAQSVAMTGAIDQFGNLQPIGAASEKIEGFFHVCRDAGLTGEQGVIVPTANRKNLVLSRDVVDACEAGQFHVWAAGSIQEALEIFTGWPAGDLDDEGEYPEGTLLALATERATAYWELASARPEFILEEVEEEDETPSDGQPGAPPAEA